jgi:hypothetical protein
MPRSEETRQTYIKGFNSGWTQCIKFVQCFVPEASGEALENIRKSMEITERNFTPRPYRDAERRLGKDAYSDIKDDQSQ